MTTSLSIPSAEDGARALEGREIARLAELYEVDRSWLAGGGTDKVDLNDARFSLASGNYDGLDSADIDMLRIVLAAMRGTEVDA